MNRILVAAVAIPALLGSTVVEAQSTTTSPPPSSPPNVDVFIGGCLHPALGAPTKGKQVALLAGLLAVAAPALIQQGFDWIGTKLAALGADKKTVLSGDLASEPQFGARVCVQVVRWDSNGQTLTTLETWKPKADSEALQVEKDRKLNFFAEYWIRPSADGEAISYTPTLLYYPSLLGQDHNGATDSIMTVSAKLDPVSGSGADATWVLPKQTPQATVQTPLPIPKVDDADQVVYGLTDDELANACDRGCVGASPWYESPWASAKVDASSTAAPAHTPGAAAMGAEKGPAAAPAAAPAKHVHGAAAAPKADPPPVGAPAAPPVPVAAVVAPGGAGGATVSASYARKPINVSMEITEVRSGSAFFADLASFFNTVKPTLETDVTQAVVPSARQQAQTDQMTADATALTAYASTLGNAETARVAYCAGGATANWTAMSATLRANQLAANVAASASHQPMPFAAPIAVSQVRQSAFCPS